MSVQERASNDRHGLFRVARRDARACECRYRDWCVRVRSGGPQRATVRRIDSGGGCAERVATERLEFVSSRSVCCFIQITNWTHARHTVTPQGKSYYTTNPSHLSRLDVGHWTAPVRGSLSAPAQPRCKRFSRAGTASLCPSRDSRVVGMYVNASATCTCTCTR